MEDELKITFWFPWWIVFALIKVYGTAFVAWSWWWLLCPLFPCVYVVLSHIGAFK